MNINNIIEAKKKQEIKDRHQNINRTLDPDKALLDVNPDTNKRRPWREKKMANELLAMAYDNIDSRKAERLRDCARVLQFRVYEDGHKRLQSMSSCRVRLCPICTWRRSLKVYHNTVRIVDFLNEKRGYNYIFLTLTVRNCSADELSATIDKLMQAWTTLFKRTAVITAVKGWMRSLEITHNVDINSESYNTYHPHFHALLCVNPSYFTSRDYISQAKWSDMWQQSLCVDYTPVIDVRKCYGTDAQAVSECAKYACKADEVVIADDWDLTMETVRTLDRALDKRRLVAYGGAMREAHKLLNLENEEDGSLVNVGAEDSADDKGKYYIESYWWYSGYRQYGRI